MFEQPENSSMHTAAASLSPLEQIQRAEADIARRVESAHERARQVEVQAHKQVEKLLHDARAQGQREGQDTYDAIVSQARLESEQLLSTARQQAQSLRGSYAARLETALSHAIDMITGMTQETGS